MHAELGTKRLTGRYLYPTRSPAEQPATLPAARAIKFEFVINLQTAKGAGKRSAGELTPSMRLIRVMPGDVVSLEQGSDERQFMHLHGYEIQTEISAR